MAFGERRNSSDPGVRGVRWLDLTVTPMTAPQVVRYLETPPIAPTMLLNHNLHSAYLYHTQDTFRRLYDTLADVVIIDGWPILKLIDGKLDSSHRIGSTDWIAELWRVYFDSPSVRKVYILGGSKVSNELARARFNREVPQWTVAGRDGYFLSQQASEICAEIERFSPDIVLIGMGMPQQEAFLLEHVDELPPAYYATVGGAIDYIAGVSRLSPRIFGALGIEWLWRLINEPRRLFPRYVIEPIRLVYVLWRSRLRHGSSSRAVEAPGAPDPTIADEVKAVMRGESEAE
jgi:N-acetylglucosaminyldiphosphoundecaprenol N-acetyl-beta-D-mannosaminyltransferase